MEQPNNNTPQWLKGLQENSYFPELFLSGTLIAVLFSLDETITEYINSIPDFVSFPGFGPFVVLLFILAYTTLTSMKISLILHFLSRMAWTAYIGLSAAFPSGVDFNKLKYAKPYNRGLNQKTKFDNNVDRLGKLSGVMFSTILMFLLMNLGFLVIIGILIFILSNAISLGETNNPLSYLLIALFITAITSLVLYFIDFISGRKIRKTSFGKYLVLPGFYLIYYPGLSFTYRKMYYSMTSKIGHYAAIGMLFFFFIYGSLIAYGPLKRFMHWPDIFETKKFVMTIDNYEYRDRVKNNLITKYATIQSYYVKDDFLEIHLNYSASTDQLMDDMGMGRELKKLRSTKQFKKASYYKKFALEDSLGNAIYNRATLILIDDQPQPKNVIWHMERSTKSRKIFVVGRVDIKHLKVGKHMLDLKGFRTESKVYETFLFIPFEKVQQEL